LLMDAMVMDNRAQTLDEFFRRYESRFNDALAGQQPDVDRIAADFAEHFIEASPAGIMAGANDNRFREAIPQGWDFYKKIGVLAMNIRSKDITMFDEMHAMVRVQWNCAFVRPDNSKGDMVFEVIYLVQLRKEGPKIFAYITGDEQKALKEEGLI
jgi:hypothetical protein